MPAALSTKKERQRVSVDLSIFATLPFMLAAMDMQSMEGRYPAWDDQCSRCVFEIGEHRAGRTFCYIVTHETHWTVKEGKRTYLRSETVRVWREMHWCSRCQGECVPMKEYRQHPFPLGYPIGKPHSKAA